MRRVWNFSSPGAVLVVDCTGSRPPFLLTVVGNHWVLAGRMTMWVNPVMDLPDVIAHFLSKPGTEETTPFGPDVLVFKVGGKIFGLTDPGEFPAKINLKCDPERAITLREEYSGIIPGYHMNKRHWNTLVLDGSVPSELVVELIDHSYALVVAALPKGKR